MNRQRCAGTALRVTRDDGARARMAAGVVQHRILEIREDQFLRRLQDGPIDRRDLKKREQILHVRSRPRGTWRLIGQTINGGDRRGAQEPIQAPPLQRCHKEPCVMREGFAVQKDVKDHAGIKKHL